MDFYNKLRQVPETAKKTIEAGRIKGMTDINPMWRIQIMTEIFGPCGIGWYYEITDKWFDKFGEEVKAFVNINLYIKVDGEWSKPIAGTGGSTLVEINKNGSYVNDEGYKMALTDALSVAMKALGVGADVYFAKGANYGTKYDAKPKMNEKEQDDLSLAIDEIKHCKTREELDAVAERWKGFYKVPEFVKAGQTKAQEFLNNGE